MKSYYPENVPLHSDEKKTLLLSVFITSCSLSTFMSLFVLIFFIIYSKISKNFASQLIIIILIMDTTNWGLRLISAIYTLSNNLVPYEETNANACILSGFLLGFFNLTVSFLVLTFGYSLFSDFVYSTAISPKRKKIFFLIFTLGFFLASIPIFSGSYGSNSILCWITSYWEILFGFFVPLWLVILIDCFFIMKVIQKMKQVHLDIKIKKNLIIKFALFPIILLFTWTPSSLKSILKTENFNLDVFMYAVMPLQGFFNPLVYGLINSDVNQKIKEFFKCNWGENSKEKEKMTLETIDIEINEGNLERTF